MYIQNLKFRVTIQLLKRWSVAVSFLFVSCFIAHASRNSDELLLTDIDRSTTAGSQYWTLHTSQHDGLLLKNPTSMKALTQGYDITANELLAAGAVPVVLTLNYQLGGSILQLDDNTIKQPVPGVNYSFQSISWYSRSVIVNEEVYTDFNSLKMSGIRVFSAGNQLNISGIDEPSIITIYKMDGSLLATFDTSEDVSTNISHTGLILVKIKNETTEQISKIVLNN
jgi:hypothetical protein